MKRIAPYITALGLVTLLLTLNACTTFRTQEKKSNPFENVELHAIVVMPVETLVSTDDQTNLDKAQQLAAGAEVMDRLLQEYFAEADTVKVLSTEQKKVLTEGYIANRAAQARAIGQRLGSDAVLMVTINRYIERQGTKYSAQQPASVAFDFKLMAVKSGRTICSGFFDETQQSLFENLLSFSGAMKRKFQWITAVDLASEGIESRFGTCSQLHQK